MHDGVALFDDIWSMLCNRMIILAAGRATRMKTSATENQGPGSPWQEDALHRPKPMIRVGSNGKPLMAFILERAERAGFTSVTVVTAPGDVYTAPFLEEWNGNECGNRLRLRCVIQEIPHGTADAVQAALEGDPLPSGEYFVLCNGDNVPSIRVLSRLRSLPNGCAMIGFDRDFLGVPVMRVRAFAVAMMTSKRVEFLIEKPSELEVQNACMEDGVVRVSMNLFRLPADALLPFLKDEPFHALRNERELTSAINRMLASGVPMDLLPAAEAVVDVTRLEDVPTAASVLESSTEVPVFEVCVSSPSDIVVAAATGADRLELCGHWECGGLTPTEAEVRWAVRSGLPVHVLIRLRAGHFTYTDDEWTVMESQIEGALAAGASRAVVGGLDANGRLELGRLKALSHRFGAHRLVIHRALDGSVSWKEDSLALRDLGIRRILSSGAAEQAIEGSTSIAWLLEQGFDVTVASGVKPDQLEHWNDLGVAGVHASCRSAEHREISFFDGTTYPVDAARVSAWQDAFAAL